jgi:hypothetical protein
MPNACKEPLERERERKARSSPSYTVADNSLGK